MPRELSVPVPSAVAPSKKLTVPLGIPDPGLLAVTVAVSVIAWPKTGVVSEEMTEVVVLAAATVWSSTDEMLAVKRVSPANTAVMV
jgi:hypothetical protein